LPYHLQTSGVGWLVALVVLVALSMVVFAGGLRGLAVGVTVLDDAVVRWLVGLDAPGLAGTWRALAFLGSWWVLNVLGLGAAGGAAGAAALPAPDHRGHRRAAADHGHL
jgi:hypothetical protein